ncbi:MAG TPA: hypothetical protein VND64_18225 [Pirellulales bacterium]|nr:hypothetical protein [Pirellulales bacterium]
MSKRRSSPKTDLVLEYLASHPATTTSQIVSDLKAHGISESLVSKVRQEAGRKVKSGAKRKSPGGTKAEAIRTVAKSLPKPFRPRDVRVELAKQGIDATTTFIGKVLRSAGMKRKRRRKAAATGAAPAVAATSASLSIDDLVAAKKVVGQVGSIEKVREALAALARLNNP